MLNKIINYIYRRIDPVRFAKKQGVQIGDNSRLINVSFGSEPWLIKLGNHVSISDARFITHDGGVWVFREDFPDIDVVAPITVGNNVFIGSGTIVLPGVSIGDNVVIGAGSIVSRDIPSNCVAVGGPAKQIFSLDEYRDRVLRKGEHTKKLSRSELRQFYLKKFSRR